MNVKGTAVKAAKKAAACIKNLCFKCRMAVKNSGIKAGDGRYYIIRYDSPLHGGWTVWERVVLFGCIYARDHGMIPVVDMMNFKNIYQEEGDLGKVNTWEEYYLQPAGVSLQEAVASGNYVLCDTSHDWFAYLRVRNRRCKDNTYLRSCYQKYIRYNEKTLRTLEQNYYTMLQNCGFARDARLLGICVRGTDYREFGHMKQPGTDELAALVSDAMEKRGFDGVFIATEDKKLFAELKEALGKIRTCSYKAGELEQTSGLIGDIIRRTKTAYEAAIDYLTVLYALDRCFGVGGGYLRRYHRCSIQAQNGL